MDGLPAHPCKGTSPPLAPARAPFFGGKSGRAGSFERERDTCEPGSRAWRPTRCASRPTRSAFAASFDSPCRSLLLDRRNPPGVLRPPVQETGEAYVSPVIAFPREALQRKSRAPFAAAAARGRTFGPSAPGAPQPDTRRHVGWATRRGVRPAHPLVGRYPRKCRAPEDSARKACVRGGGRCWRYEAPFSPAPEASLFLGRRDRDAPHRDSAGHRFPSFGLPAVPGKIDRPSPPSKSRSRRAPRRPSAHPPRRGGPDPKPGGDSPSSAPPREGFVVKARRAGGRQRRVSAGSCSRRRSSAISRLRVA